MYTAPVLRKGIEILRLVTRTNEPLGVSDISRKLSIVKSTTLGILKALEEEGFLVQDRVTKKYLPGNTLFEFSRRVLRSTELSFVAKPFLQKLVEQVNETVILATNEYDHTYRVLQVSEPNKELKITVPVNTSFPFHTGALMKVFLTQMTDEAIAALVRANPLPKYTDHSVTEIEDLLAQVRQVREQGYAADLEEYHKGVRALSVLLFRGSRACASVSIFGLASSMDDQKLPGIIAHMKEAAQLISRKLTLMAEGRDGADALVDRAGPMEQNE